MTPEIKAKELIEKFKQVAHAPWNEVTGFDVDALHNNSKACAIICVDEIIKECSPYLKNTLNYWQQVKTFLQSK